MKLFGKKKKEEETAIEVRQEELKITIKVLETDLRVIREENEWLRAELQKRSNEDAELMRRGLRAQIAKDESPFGQSVSSETLGNE